MSSYHRLVIYFDGASKHNPHGPAGCGWIIYPMNKQGGDNHQNPIARGYRYLGYNVSNNQAEYKGLEDALSYLLENDISCDGLYIRGDSEIVLKQLNGSYKVRSKNLKGYYREVFSRIRSIDKIFVKYTHVDRNRNKVADGLANQAIENEAHDIW